MDKKRILIIDDEALIRRALADYLTESGYEAVTAADGAKGLTLARESQFQVVLVDLRMPHVDGLQVIATLSAEQPALPIVVISGTGVLGDAIEAMRRGACDYITKPVMDIDEIMVVIERVLEKARIVAERDQYQNELEQLNRELEAEVSKHTRDLWVRYRELQALNRVSGAISDPLDMDTMIDRAIDAALAAIETESGAVWLVSPQTGKLGIAVARGLPESCISSDQAVSLGEGIIGQVAQTGRPQSGKDFADDPWLVSLDETAGLHSFLCVPLRAGDEVALFTGSTLLADVGKKHPIVGTLVVAIRDEREFRSGEVDLMTNIGNQIGVGVARAWYAANLKKANFQLARANANLRRLDALREQFIQNVAHELRTPLALAHGYVEMLVEGGLDPEEEQMALGVVSRRMQTLVTLVESITTLQDLDSQPLQVEPVAPSELLLTACQMTAQRAAGAGIELRSVCQPDTPSFLADFTQLAQVLHQMMDNSCKFSPEGTTVIVAIEVAEENAILTVADQGIGIPDEEHAYIFDLFYQVDGSTTRRYGGTGLGLAIVKQTVEAHGGEVTVESVVGEGSTFTVTLPLKRG